VSAVVTGHTVTATISAQFAVSAVVSFNVTAVAAPDALTPRLTAVTVTAPVYVVVVIFVV
jgi:hypothetical protein